jgi:hypothetical protein
MGLLGAAVVLVLAGAGGGAGSALAVTWSTVATPNAAGATHSALYDMACEPWSTNGCTAVGKKTTAGVSTPYAQYWDGSSWINVPTASPSGATAGELQADTCLFNTSCVAVGHYTTGSGTFSLAEAWNGGNWSIQTTPNPSGATDSRLRGVSCAVITACIAVGYSVSGTGVKSAMAQRGNSGTWSLQSVSPPSGATESELQGVDCTSSTFCVAVGRYNTNSSTYLAWSATWNGSSWTVRTVPSPSNAVRSVLLDVSCTDAANCTAVGGSRDASNKQSSFAVRWNGSSWVNQSTPNPTGSANTVLQNVSCGERNWCVAVGDWLTSTGPWQTMAQTWNGSGWSLDTTPNPAGATLSIFEGVACRFTCLTIGWSTSSSGIDTTLGASRPAPTWIQKTLPTPLSNEKLNDITCYVPNGCFAVGVGAGHARLYLGGTGSWVSYGTVEPTGADSSELHGAHCRYPSYWCAAVGEYTSGGSTLPYAASDDDSGAWDLHSVPSPGAPAALNDVDCNSSVACMAAGYFTDAGVKKTFSSFWNGSTWSTRTPLNAPGSTENVLNGIACPSSSLDCVAVGSALIGGVRQPLVQRWSSFTWAIHTSPLPSGASSGTLLGLSCVWTGPVTCMAVGEADSHAYAIRWTGSGTSWTVVPAPHPPFAQDSRFEDVSCASPTECVAVGHYSLPGAIKRTFAADWDGTSWTLHSTPNPGGTGNDLLGVSCVSSMVCRTAGYANNPSAFNLAATLN